VSLARLLTTTSSGRAFDAAADRIVIARPDPCLADAQLPNLFNPTGTGRLHHGLEARARGRAVSDVDQAKSFYTDTVGFVLLVDHRAGDFRVVQLTPPGSSCAIALMSSTAAGSIQGLHLIVSVIDAARAELVERGADVSSVFHYEEGIQVPGADPGRGDYA